MPPYRRKKSGWKARRHQGGPSQPPVATMPGIQIEMGENSAIQMTGGMTRAAEGVISPEMFLMRMA